MIMDPYRYRDIDFTNLTTQQTENILENAYLIRTLTVDLMGAGYFLQESFPRETMTPPVSPYNFTALAMTAKSTTPTNLKDLRCIDYGFDDNEWTTEELTSVDRAVNALNLIELNPNLSSLKIDYKSWRYPGHEVLTDRVLEFISRHSNLTRIQWVSNAAYGDDIVRFLPRCPRSLQDLEISGCYSHRGRPQAQQEVKSLKDQKLPFSLRRLSLEGDICDHEKDYMFPLLQNSPKLEELSLPRIDDYSIRGLVDTIHQFCPGLRKISINNQECPGLGFVGLWGTAAAHLLLPDLSIPVADENSTPPVSEDGHKPNQLNLRQSSLREIQLSLCQDANNVFYRAILGSGAIASSSPSQLQVLHIVDGALNSRTLPARILNRCPYMKDLSIDGGLDIDWTSISRLGVDLKALVEQDWVCTKMESLKLDIGIEKQDDGGYSTGFMEFADLLRRLYQKLCSLKSLRKLELVWVELGKLYFTPIEILLSVMNNVGEDDQKDQRIKITRSDLEWMGLIGWPTTSQLNEHHHRNIVYSIALKCHRALGKPDDAQIIEYYLEDGFPDGNQNRAECYESWDGLMDPWYLCDEDDEWLDEPWYSNRKTYVRIGKCHKRNIVRPKSKNAMFRIKRGTITL
ncbi:hypothetical protein BGX26_008402 [Mortierella sp. AD094]|nr:hypothetical protein BGX26_008402 [Mortierella sp. AD094]